jgi:hypothetical protein
MNVLFYFPFPPKVLTNFLVIYRVLLGRAWDRETENRLSTLNWEPRGAGMTTFGTVDVDLPQTSISEEDPPEISFRKGV